MRGYLKINTNNDYFTKNVYASIFMAMFACVFLQTNNASTLYKLNIIVCTSYNES